MARLSTPTDTGLEQYGSLLTGSQKRKFEKAMADKDKPTFFQKIVSWLTTGETGNAAYALLEGKNPVEAYGKDIIKGIHGTGYDKRTYADVLERLGMQRTALSEKLPELYSDTGKGLQLKKGGFLDPTDTGSLGLLLDILGDPVTYLGGAGLFSRLSKSFRYLKKPAVELFEQKTKDVAKQMAKQHVKEGSEKAAILWSKAYDGIADTLKKDPDKYFKGITFMGKEIVPRKYALAPGRYADKLMGHIPIAGKVYQGAKYSIQDLFKYGADIVNAGKSLAGEAGELTAEQYIKSKIALFKEIRFNREVLAKNLSTIFKSFAKAVKKGDREAVLKSVRDTVEQRLGHIGVEGVDDNLAQGLINDYNKFLKDFYVDERKAKALLGERMYQRLSGYMPHIQTEQAKLANAAKNRANFKLKAWRMWSSRSEKGRSLYRWVSQDGEIMEGTAKERGLTKIPPIKGMVQTLNEGQYKTLNAIEKELKRWGVEIEYKPRPTVGRQKAWGYWSPKRKKIVIASMRPTVDDILETITHESTHNLDFQFAGHLEMIKTFSKRKGTLYSRFKDVLETASDNVREEWKNILKAHDISQADFAKLTRHYQDYYKEPTELLSRAEEIIAKNPARAKKLFPKTVESLQKMHDMAGYFRVNDLKVAGDTADIVGHYVDKTGKIWKIDRPMTISEINKMMEPFMEKSGYKGKPFLETDPFTLVYSRGQESFRKVAAMKHYRRLIDDMGKVGNTKIEYTRNKFTGKTTAETVVEPWTDLQTGIKYIDPKIKELPPGTLLPDFIVDDMKKAVNIINDKETTNKILKVYDKMLGHWKGSVYGWYPASHGRNFIGGTFNNFLANPKSFIHMMNPKVTYDIVSGKNGSVKLGNTVYSYGTLRREIGRRGILGQTGFLDVNELNKAFNPGFWRHIGRAPMKAMETVENNLRVPLFLAELADGKSFDQAAKKVFKYHFDYAPEGLSTFERKVMRRFIPFYTWNRKNVPLMLEEFIAQPGKMTATFKMLRNAQDENGNLMEDLLPSYIQQQFAVSRGGQTTTGLGLPPIEMLKYFDQPIKQIGASLVPSTKIPIELITHYNLYKDKQIADDNSGHFANNYSQPLKNFLEWREVKVPATKDRAGYTYSVVNPIRKYWLYALPTSRLASIITMFSGEDEKNKILNFTSGLRTYEFDMARLKASADSSYEKQLLEILKSAGLFSKYGTPYKSTKEKLGE